MHGKSIEYYNQNTDEFINRTICADMSFCQKKFTELLPPGSYILDAGCGSGRDSKLFIESGFRVLAMDVSSQMCLAAAKYIAQPVECLRFDELQFDSCFDGIWACASLLHVPKAELPNILRKFHKALKPEGIMYASVKYGDREEERLHRFFSDYHMDELENVFLQDDLYQLIESFETEDVRPDYKNKPWLNIMVRKK